MVLSNIRHHSIVRGPLRRNRRSYPEALSLGTPGWKSGAQGLPCRADRASDPWQEVISIADENKDQGHSLTKIALVLEAIRLLAELLR